MRCKFLSFAVAATLTASLAACTSGGSGTEQPSDGGGAVASGGTLVVAGIEDHAQIDPVAYALVATDSIARTITRQLISYEASNDTAVNTDPKPDLAAELPTVSDDGLTYTFTIRSDAMWDAATPRAITSKDMANGLKKICNPMTPAFSVDYFYSIEGFEDFCKAYDTENPSVEDIKKHITEDSPSGISTPDDSTLVIKLTEPTSDFIYVLSLPNASPVPAEALEYEPNSPDYIKNYISSGPYTIDEYAADSHLYLKRSAGWVAESDPLRAANVDRIEITYGMTADSILQQIQSGDADMMYGMTVPPANFSTLEATEGDNLLTWPSAGSFFLWMNSVTTNNDSALAKKEVRQALQYGIDKAALVQQLGGEKLANPAIGIFGSGVVGHSTNDPYATEGNAGDPDKVKELLEAAGVKNLKLKLAYRSDNTVEPAMAQIIQESFKKAGVEIELVGKPGSDFYGNFMMVHENAANGEWDLALCGWSPDWAGGAARSVFQPQFTFSGTEQAYNYTDYNNDEANGYMAEAMKATAEESAALWAKVSDAVMADPPVIPLYERTLTSYHSARIPVDSYKEFALAESGDWTNVTISE
jgi:peptide/nickel transport system substrate-binding protein